MQDTSALSRLAAARLYGIIDLGYARAEDVERTAREMCEGGVQIIQLRAKGHDEHFIEELANRIQPILSAKGVVVTPHKSGALLPHLMKRA